MKKKKMNHQLKEEEDQKTKIDLTIFKSPGVSVIEHNITIVKSSNHYKIFKLQKILNRIMSV
jgi:hypothetical protein